MEMAVRQPFTSGSIDRGFKDAFLSTQFWHGLHNAMVAVQRQLRTLFSSRRCSTTKLPAWLVSVHGNKIADDNGDAKQFFLLCSVRSTHEGEQAASVRLLCVVICDLSCVDLLEKAQNFSACGGHSPPAAPAAGCLTNLCLQGN